MERALVDPSEFVREGAAGWLNLWTGDEAVQRLLAEATKDRVSDVRNVAVAALAVSWPADATTRAALWRCGCSVYESTRGLVARVLSTDADLHHLGREKLLAMAGDGDDRAAVVLAGCWADDPGVADVLRDRVRSDDHVVRAAVLQGLATRQSADPRTRDLIGAALGDPCPGVRFIAYDSFWQTGQFITDLIESSLADTDCDIRYQGLISQIISSPARVPPAAYAASLSRAETVYQSYWLFGLAAADAVGTGWSMGELLETAAAAVMLDSDHRAWLDWLSERHPAPPTCSPGGGRGPG
jgi:hypothetical protein